jgi:hypothetical protein
LGQGATAHSHRQLGAEWQERVQHLPQGGLQQGNPSIEMCPSTHAIIFAYLPNPVVRRNDNACVSPSRCGYQMPDGLLVLARIDPSESFIVFTTGAHST